MINTTVKRNVSHVQNQTVRKKDCLEHLPKMLLAESNGIQKVVKHSLPDHNCLRQIGSWQQNMNKVTVMRATAKFFNRM